MRSQQSALLQFLEVSLLMIGVAAAPLIAGAPCWDIVQNNQIIDPCVAGAECLGNCNLFDDITPGSTHLTVWSGTTPVSIVCYPGTVKVDQFGVCHCMNLNLNSPKSTLVGSIKGDSACTP